MRLRTLFTLLAICISTASFAQTGSLQGLLTDSDSQAKLSGATVTLLNAVDSQVVSSMVTDPRGRISFRNIAAGKYIIRISMIGYRPYFSDVTLTDEEKQLGMIRMEKEGKELQGVTVVSKTPLVIQKADTSQFSASQYKVNPDASTEDLVKKMPGITVDKDGTVTAQGEQVKKLTIDGKDYFGDDVSAALKNLPSEVVDKIQVFDRLSDQAQLTGFDDGNSQKAINIVTKSGIKNSQFGRLYAGYGTDDRYQAGGNVSFYEKNRRISLIGNFNNINQQNFGSQDLLGVSSGGNNRGGGQGGNRGGMGGGRGGSENFQVGQSSGISRTNAFGLNLSNQWGSKVTLSGSYFFNNGKNNNDAFTNTETFAADNRNLFSTQNSNSITDNFNHRINARLEIKFDSSNSLFIIPSLNFQKNSSNSFSSLASYFSSTDSVNTSLTSGNSDRNGYNIRNTIMFRHSFRKKGRSLSLSLNNGFTKNDGESITDASYRFFNNGFITDSLQNQFYDNSTTGYSIGGNIAYTEPVGKKSQIQVDYSPNFQKNKADQQTFLFDGQKYATLDTTLSNRFDNIVTTHNAGLSYRYNPNKDEMFSFGFNVQQSRLESDRVFPTLSNVDQSFSNVLPNAMWRKKISNSSSFRLFYRASVNFPAVTQLQDVVNLSNPLRVSSGNPLLQQSYTHLLGGRWTYTNSKTSRSFFANIFLQTTADYISNATYIAGADSVIQQGIELKKGSQLTKPVNLNGYRSLRSFFTYSMPIRSIKTNINLNAGIIYNRLPALVNYRKTITDNFIYSGGVVFASNISEYVDFNLSYNLNINQASTNSGSTADNNYSFQAAGLQLNLLNKKGWFVQNDVSNQTYSGLSGGLNQSFWLWNAAIGKKFLKKKAGELKLSVFDILKQNQSISRTVTETYIQDAQSRVLQQYFMLTFTYNLKNFGKTGNKQQPASDAPSDMRPGSRGMGGPGF
jgi:hypothetical protein